MIKQLSPLALALLALAGILPSHADPAYKPESGSAAEKKSNAWTYTHDPKLPNVLILGDSISIGYSLPLRRELKGEANVYRPLDTSGSRPENCQGTIHGVKNIDRWLAGRRWDIIHFNFGLHDLKHVNANGENSSKASDPYQAPLEDYSKNLEVITGKLAATGAKLIYATTTPVAPGTTNPLREPEAPLNYNAAALKIMKARGIEVNDLHALCEGRLAELQLPKNVHFKEQGNKVLTKQVAKVLRAALDAGEENTSIDH